MAGALWGYYLTYLGPTIFLTILVGAKFVLMTILGGRGTVAGPVVGAVVFIVANEFFVASFGATELNIAATGLLLILVLLFFPEGIVGTLKHKGRLPRVLDWDSARIPASHRRPRNGAIGHERIRLLDVRAWPRPGSSISPAFGEAVRKRAPERRRRRLVLSPTTIRVGFADARQLGTEVERRERPAGRREHRRIDRLNTASRPATTSGWPR